MKKNKLVFSICIFLIISLIVFIASIRGKIPGNIFCFLDIGTYGVPPGTIEVYSSQVCGQSFISNFDNLFMMSIFVPNQNLREDKELYFHLKKNEADDKDLITLKWKFNQIHFSENNFYIVPPDRETGEKGFHFHFQFPPIEDSKNKEFYFYFESPNAKQGEGIKLGVWNNRQYYEALTKGKMFINHKPTNDFLAFRTYNTWKGDVKNIWGGICSRFFKDLTFARFYLCLITITFLGLLLAKR